MMGARPAATSTPQAGGRAKVPQFGACPAPGAEGGAPATRRAVSKKRMSCMEELAESTARGEQTVRDRPESSRRLPKQTGIKTAAGKVKAASAFGQFGAAVSKAGERISRAGGGGGWRGTSERPDKERTSRISFAPGMRASKEKRRASCLSRVSSAFGGSALGAT